jgi:hypothetical protein
LFAGPIVFVEIGHNFIQLYGIKIIVISAVLLADAGSYRELLGN